MTTNLNSPKNQFKVAKWFEVGASLNRNRKCRSRRKIVWKCSESPVVLASGSSWRIPCSLCCARASRCRFQYQLVLRSPLWHCLRFWFSCTDHPAASSSWWFRNFSLEEEESFSSLTPTFWPWLGRQTTWWRISIEWLTESFAARWESSWKVSKLNCEFRWQHQVIIAIREVRQKVEKPFHAAEKAVQHFIPHLQDLKKEIVADVDELKKQVVLIGNWMNFWWILLQQLQITSVKHIEHSYAWLRKVLNMCDKGLGTPFEKCNKVFQISVSECRFV